MMISVRKNKDINKGSIKSEKLLRKYMYIINLSNKIFY